MDISRMISGMQEAATSALQVAQEAVSEANKAGGTLALSRAKDVFSFADKYAPAASDLQQPVIAPEAGLPDPASFLNSMALAEALGSFMELLTALSDPRMALGQQLQAFGNALEQMISQNTIPHGQDQQTLSQMRNAISDLAGLYQQTSSLGMIPQFSQPVFSSLPDRFMQPQGGIPLNGGQNSYSIQETHSYGERFGPGSNLPAYGSQGTTLAEGEWGLKFAEANFQGQGDWGSGYFRGETFIGARARVFGDVDWDNRSFSAGFEAEVGARAHYEAGYRTPNGPVGAESDMAADAFAGAQARGTAELSLNENTPRVAVGAEAFQGARAGLDVGGGLTIDGNRLAGAHYGVEGWSGVGAAVNVDLGFKDGNFRFDFSGGLALLIGAEVSFGFDIGFGDLFRSTTKLGEDILNGIGSTAESAAKDVGKAAEDVGKTVANVAGDAAKGVADAAGGAVKTVGKVLDSIF